LKIIKKWFWNIEKTYGADVMYILKTSDREAPWKEFPARSPIPRYTLKKNVCPGSR
jgi:hypothetical protein